MIVTRHASERFCERVFGLDKNYLIESQIRTAEIIVIHNLEYRAKEIDALFDCRVKLMDFSEFSAIIKGKKVVTIVKD